MQESEFVILASDGVWDTLKNLEAVTKVRRWMMDGMTPEEAARELVNTALKLGSTDNASAVILRWVGTMTKAKYPQAL
jgi:serine/threonine protein phosphatase PrpC